jgi:hypothetical protein
MPVTPDHLFGRRRFLGEYYCFWLGDTLGIRDNELIDDLTVATALGRASAVLHDVMADLTIPATRRYRQYAATLRQAAVDRFASAVPDKRVFGRYARLYFKRSTTADETERRRHWNRLSPFTPADMAVLGQKTSACFIPAVALCLMSGQPESIPRFERFIEARNAAIQIWDDLADWREDLAVGNLTLPLTIGLRLMGLNSSTLPLTRQGRERLQRRLAAVVSQTGMIQALLQLSDVYLALALSLVSDRPQLPPALYVTQLRGYVAAVLTRLAVLAKHHRTSSRTFFSIKDGRWPMLQVASGSDSRAEDTRQAPAYVEGLLEVVRSMHPKAALT